MFSFNDDNLTKSTDVQIIICYNVDEMMQELFLDSSKRELIGSNNIMIQKCMERLLNYWNITQLWIFNICAVYSFDISNL